MADFDNSWTSPAIALSGTALSPADNKLANAAPPLPLTPGCAATAGEAGPVATPAVRGAGAAAAAARGAAAVAAAAAPTGSELLLHPDVPPEPVTRLAGLTTPLGLAGLA